MEEIKVAEIPTEKIYKDNLIWLGTFLGGPLAGGYLIAENYRAFNEPGKVMWTWIYTIIATICIFSCVFIIPDSAKIPGQLIPIFYTLIIYSLMKHFQGASVTAHINSGGQVYGWGRVIIIGLSGLVITLVLLFMTILLTGFTI